jgi:hypothetical protein
MTAGPLSNSSGNLPRVLLAQRFDNERGKGEHCHVEGKEKPYTFKGVHEDVVILAELGLLERTEGGGLICPYSSMHIDMYLKAA